MSTDDSISEDVSSSGALSHCHASADGGKESETSLVSSEATSASGVAVSEDRHTTSQTTGGTVENRPVDITPTCNKIRCGNFQHFAVYRKDATYTHDNVLKDHCFRLSLRKSTRSTFLRQYRLTWWEVFYLGVKDAVCNRKEKKS